MIRFLSTFFIGSILFIAVQGFSQQHILFNYSLEEGLPQSSVLDVYQDAFGNIWMGTQGGVSRYNGNSFVNFDTRHGLGDNHVTSIFQDSRGKYWFGHRYNGVTAYFTNNFKNYPFTDQQVNKILEDKNGNIWFGVMQKGLYMLPSRYDTAKPDFKRINLYTDLPESGVNDMVTGENNLILVGTTEGLYTLKDSGESEDFELFNFSSGTSDMPFDFIISIAKESDDTYWIMGFEGIVKIKISSKNQLNVLTYLQFAPGVHISSNNNITLQNDGTVWGTHETGIFKIEGDTINYNFKGTGYKPTTTHKVICDKENNLWISTMDQGVFKYSDDMFLLLDEADGLSNNVVKSVIEDQSGNVWTATEMGVSVWDGSKFHHFNNSNKLPANSIDVVFEDSKGNIWIGNVFRGDPVVRYNPQSGTFTEITQKDGIPHNSVLTINEDKEGNIWFASLWNSPFYYTYPQNGKPGSFTSVSKEDGLCSNRIWHIHRDLKGDMWFGSDNGGLSCLSDGKFITFNEQDGLTNLSPGALAHDSRNNIWIASIGGGIFKFDGKKFTNYSINDGLSSDSPFSIVCDENDIIWIGTNSGIDRFNPVHKTFKHYGKSDGFVGIETNQNAVFKTNSGKIWFGTIHGLVRFDPSLDKPNTIPPVTLIEDIKLFYNPFDYSHFADSIDNFTGLPLGLKLGYGKNHLSFNYVGISHVSPDKVTYRYMLENFDDHWNPVTRTTSATYTNIPPGKYSFKVMAANNDGVWDTQTASIAFTILPPYWQTTWFRLLVILFTSGLIYLVFYWRLRAIKMQKKKLEVLVDKKTIELKLEADERKKAQLKAEESDKLKTSFLANMSHEIRTPVNAIVGFADLLKDPQLTESDKNTYLEYIVGGGKTLMTLINDIIDISKIEAGQINISRSSCNLNSLFSELYMTFTRLLKKHEKQNIELRMIIPQELEGIEIFTDNLRLKQILTNLIGNAVKFTDTGFIEFGVTVADDQKLIFYVKDSGIGIPSDKLDIVFQRFRQVEESYTRNFEGTGLGLAISKKLTNLMGGEMWVESIHGKGSQFFFSLPFEPVEGIEVYHQPVELIDRSELSEITLLVVEDEESNFLLIKTMLQHFDIKLLHEKDGNSALETYKKQMDDIDLILMDIKIPGPNGYETTTAIKKINSEVPVIAQTAYAISGEREKCIAAGCDDYISKPYNKTELLNLIKRYGSKAKLKRKEQPA
ncbi:MAG: response regulator [Bacteroidales bacterium]|nr:response regulator [Bacteroidales bacterium]